MVLYSKVYEEITLLHTLNSIKCHHIDTISNLMDELYEKKKELKRKQLKVILISMD